MQKIYSREEAILKGIDVFWEQGYGSTGIQQTLKVANIPRSSFYNYFGSKKEFAIAVVHGYTDLMIKNYITPCFEDTTKTSLEKIEAFYSTTIENNKKTKCSRGCLLNNFANEFAGVDRRMAKIIEKDHEKILRIIGNCIKQGQKSGEIRRDYNHNYLANYMQNNYNGSLVSMKVLGNTQPIEIFLEFTLDFLRA